MPISSETNLVGLLIPTEQGVDLVQVGDLSQQVLEVLEFLFRFHGCPYEDEFLYPRCAKRLVPYFR
jgi:hypothetical protein